VTETILDKDDCPWTVLRRRGQDSVRLMELTRFYLEQKKDPHGPDVSLFVGNLPANLSQKQYETILNEHLGEGHGFDSIGPIYYEYGFMVITFDNSEAAVFAYELLRTCSHDDKKLLAILLPAVKPDMMRPEVCPLLVFVNVKSGGGRGAHLMASFRKLLNPNQVFDLCDGGPLAGLYVFRKVEKYRILVCGGDGTIGWVLQCLDNVGQDSECYAPPCAIIPLGTGNDLARVLQWGGSYTGSEEPMSLLKDVIEAEEIRLDRWTVVFRPKNPEELDGVDSKGRELQPSNAQTSEENAQIYVMNNYFGIGIDAKICLEFHEWRTRDPDFFNSQLKNKGVYALIGFKDFAGIGSGVCKNLHRDIRLEVDGKHIELPTLRGILILNIQCWASGANAWGAETDDKFPNKPNHWDGLLEVVGLSGSAHMGFIQGGVRSGMRIIQVKCALTVDLRT